MNVTVRKQKSLNTILEYLENSNYDISSFNKDEFTKSNFNEKFIVNSDNGKAFVYYNLDNFTKSNLQTFIKSNIEKDEITKEDIMIIITTKFTFESFEDVIKYKTYGIYVNLYKLENLTFNILKHSYVPKHEKLTLKEKDEFLKKYNIRNTSIEIPEIGRFDPVACAIFLKPGDVCKITRYDKISYENEYYRICVV